MVAEILRYLVVCGCTGTVEEIAHIDDDRQFGHPLVVRAREGRMIGIGPQVSGPEPQDEPDKWAAKFSEYNVTQTFWNRWGEPRITWSIRCMECDQQAQMSEATFESVADQLSSQREQFGVVPVPSTPSATTIAEDRYVIPLGVLCGLAAQSNG